MRKAILLYLTDKYEEELISSTGKHKEDYVGQIGKICKVQHLYDKTTHWIDLFDIEFDDGAMFCVDREQIEFDDGAMFCVDREQIEFIEVDQ